jgi:predicted esterase
MTAAHPSKRMLVAGILSIAMGGCGDSTRGGAGSGGSTSPAGGAGGITADGGSGASSGLGGSVATGGSASGGMSDTGGATSHADTGGTTGNGGTAASGGSTGAAGQAGGTAGNGGQPGDGGQAGTGGQGGRGMGGRGQTGGMTGTGGRAGTGGQAGQETGGRGQTGGTTGAGGQTGNGGQAGQETGGRGQTGGTTGVGGQTGNGGRLISFGTLLDPQAVMSAAQALAKSLANPNSSQWRAKGDQHRTYRFADAGSDEPYRLYVPTDWDGQSELPLVMFLHGAGSNENTYVDQNNKQMLNLAQEHGYLLVSPMGDQGAYGNFLRLTAPFGNEAGAAELMAQVTTDSERTNELSEQDVINVLELVLAEYPVDRASMFLAGHSMGSGGTWYIGGKYPDYWHGLAPMSGPFVQESGYPWDSVRSTAIFVTEGTQAPSLDASRLLRDWLEENGFNAEYEEVNADHGGMISLVLPDIFDFFDRSRAD